MSPSAKTAAPDRVQDQSRARADDALHPSLHALTDRSKRPPIHVRIELVDGRRHVVGSIATTDTADGIHFSIGPMAGDFVELTAAQRASFEDAVFASWQSANDDFEGTVERMLAVAAAEGGTVDITLGDDDDDAWHRLRNDA